MVWKSNSNTKWFVNMKWTFVSYFEDKYKLFQHRWNPFFQSNNYFSQFSEQQNVEHKEPIRKPTFVKTD